MSSPKKAPKSSRPKAAAVRPARRARRAPPPKGGASETASRLAAEMERGLARGEPVLSPEAVQALMAAVCKTYAAQIEAGGDFMPLGQRSGVSPTDIMVTASKLLRAGNLQVFELGMWQSWTGR
jgi:hypothetical protein